MVMMISQNKIAGVSRILAVAIRNGASASAICDKLDRAISGTYAPQSGWTDREFAVAFLVKAIGGSRLLYTLQKAEGYPSVTTLRRRKPIPEVVPSLGTPRDDEINLNISALLGENGRKPPTNRLCGQVVMIDGVAIEQAVRFDFNRKSALGLCREHSNLIKKGIDDVQDLHNIAKALDNGVCHYGKDGTILGVAPVTDKENYHVVPIVVSPSCKSEKGEDIAAWVKIFLRNWRTNPNGAALHGEVTTLATDGESSFRKLRFLLCLTKDLDRNSELGKILYQLPGLNCRTGENILIGTCDPKHVVKRFATLIRSPMGIQIGDGHFTSIDALRKLELKMTSSEAALLLNPADKQNVPKAVNLIQSLQPLDLEDQYEDNIMVMPSHINRVQGIEFVAKVLSFFLIPFIDVEMTLSEQIRDLSTFAHLATALYLKHHLGFLTSALYADSQAIVKSILFNTARLQLVDLNINYYILFEGTDRLENVFSQARTQDHARNFDILQLAHKLSIGAEIDAIFQRYPDLYRGHLRRNLRKAQGIDHINPKSWVGTVRVGDVDIKGEYLTGRDEANQILVERFGESASVDFDKLFKSDPLIDHLRPGKRYVGFSVSGEPEVDENDLDNESLTGPLISVPNSDKDDEFEDAREEVDSIEHTGFDIEPEDLNPSLQKSNSHYLTIEGARHYIPTLINDLLGADKEKRRLVTTRPLRAQGVTLLKALKPDSILNSSGDELDTSTPKVKSGDLGGILVRVNDEICLVVGEILNFRQGTSKINLAGIEAEDLDADGAKATTVAIQILQLLAQEHQNKSAQEGLTWMWPQKYIQIQESKDGVFQHRHFVTRIPGSIFHLAAPDIKYDREGKPIWSLNDSDLKNIFERAWSDLEPDSPNIAERVKRLPKITGPGVMQLPYKSSGGEPHYFLSKNDLPPQLNIVKIDGKVDVKCYLCSKVFQLKDMRNHVGIHLLKAFRQLDDPLLDENGQVRRIVLCGACRW